MRIVPLLMGDQKTGTGLDQRLKRLRDEKLQRQILIVAIANFHHVFPEVRELRCIDVNIFGAFAHVADLRLCREFRIHGGNSVAGTEREHRR